MLHCMVARHRRRGLLTALWEVARRYVRMLGVKPRRTSHPIEGSNTPVATVDAPQRGGPSSPAARFEILFSGDDHRLRAKVVDPLAGDLYNLDPGDVGARTVVLLRRDVARTVHDRDTTAPPGGDAELSKRPNARLPPPYCRR